MYIEEFLNTYSIRNFSLLKSITYIIYSRIEYYIIKSYLIICARECLANIFAFLTAHSDVQIE